MRYLTKLTPQLRSLISKEYADTIVWKGADQDMDVDQDDDYDNEDSDDDDTKHERFFKFEVSRTTEQEEGAEIYPGFELGHRAIVTPTFPSDVMVPDTVSDTLQCRLVFGETKQGFLSARFIPYEKESRILNSELRPLALIDFLNRHQNIYLGKDLTEDGFGILLKDGGLEKRAERQTNKWKTHMKRLLESRDSEIREGLAQVQTSIATGHQELSRQARNKVVTAFSTIFPLLEAGYLKVTQEPSEDGIDPEFWGDLSAKYPAVSKAEAEVVDTKRISQITCSKYVKVKRRVLGQEDELLGCEELSEDDRNRLFNNILHDERRDDGLWAKLSSVAGKLFRVEHRPRADPLKTTDSEFMEILHSMAQHPHMRLLVEEIFALIYNWVNKKIDELSPKLVEKIESIERREMENQVREQAKLQERNKRVEALDTFREALQTILLPEPDRPGLTINSARRRTSNFGHAMYELKGLVESEKAPCIEHTLFVLELTESDKTHIQEDPRFVPRPEAYGVASFRLPLQDSIRHIQAIGNKILLIVDKPSGISIWLSERSRIGYDAPVKHFPTSKRRYLFAIHEQRRQLAIAYIEPTGQILLQIQAFDEKFTSIQARGSPQNVTSWYQDGSPDIQHICFAGGPEELCIVEGTGRVRIYSFVSQGFRAATLQLPSDLDVQSAHSAPDDSAMIIVERVPPTGYQLRVYHWNSFGQLPEGCILPLPDSIDFRSTTEFCPSSIGQRTNAAIIAIIPDQRTIRSINMQIKTKNTAYSFKSKDGKNTKVLENTVHNCFIDCHADVWGRYPVVPAIKRETISSQPYEPLPSLTFACEHDARLFSTYFKRMMKDFEQVTKKPTERVLDAVEVRAGSIEDLDWDSLEARTFKAGEWFVELLCLIPIHIAVARHNSFIPLKDGVLDPLQEQRLLGATVDQIIDSISLGWYESIFNSYMAKKPVKVVSSMGEQSVGKSFTLNHIVDSSFAGSALRTTEGVWLSVCPTRDTLVVALDFEGVHSIERSPQEDMLLVLFNTALSNMVLFRNNFALSRDVANMFTSFQASTALLDPAANPKLFKSLLTIIIKDVVEGDKKEIVKEFSSKFSQIVSEEQEANFITVLHASQLTVIPWPVIQSRPFYTLFSKLRTLLFKQPTTHASAGEFLITLKTLMAKLKAQDWGSIDQNLTKHRVSLLMSTLPIAMATGFAELEPETEELKNLDNQASIPWSDDSSDVQLCLSKSTADRAAPLATIINKWRPDAARYDVDELSDYLDNLVSARLHHVHEWVKSNISRFSADSADIRSFKAAVDDSEELLKAGVQICRVDCSSCRLPCLLPKAHDSKDHNCQTSHKCLESCEYAEEHTEDDETICSLPAGHAGRHLCDPTSHSCGEQCDLAGHRGCQHTCMKAPEHSPEEGHLCSARNHQCGKPCDLKDIIIVDMNGRKSCYSCPNFCVAPYDEEHDDHVCADKLACPVKCQLCSRLCTMGDHLHGVLDGEIHLCRQEHTCPYECEAQGICEINTEPRSVETTFTGTHETFQFTKYTQIANRLRCAVPITPGDLGHTGPHTHSTAANVFHYCEAKCENCGYICHLPLNHPQREHETKHGSMQNTAWAIEGNADAIVEVQGRKYAARDAGTPHICSSVCTQLGRHAHIDYCRTQDGSCQGNDSVHIKERMLPNPDRGKDWISHKLFWARTGFKDPYPGGEQTEFSKCDVQCAGKEHEATATTAARPSFCTLPIFHPPQPLNWTGAGNGYVSADGHAFACVNPNNMRQAFHVIFVLDRSGSMSDTDRKPLPNTPSTTLITRHNNNRFGAVLSALNGFWLSRATTGTARRDSYTVIVFNEASQIIVNNDFTSTPDQLLNRVVATYAGGGTYFDGALKTAQTSMENHWTNDRAPVIIFLSDGECSVSDPVVFDICNKAVALSKPLSFHAVSFGDNRWSQSLRRMVTIADQVSKNAPKDPLAPQPVPCGYTDAMDSIKLAETFLNIADSLKKPKA
ncbi:hypothetical protein FRC02_012397, partial [Tulasnella sp. 418]